MKLLLICLLFPLISLGQREYKITSVDSIKGMTVFFTCFYEDCYEEFEIKGAFINFRGLGKIPDILGRQIKHYPKGFGRRKTKFILLKK